jgi:DNA transformation protein and related proteins
MKDTSFKDFILDQLHDVQEFQCRKIPEGYGLFWGKNFFGVLSEGKLFFRTNDKTVKTYTDAGMGPIQSKKASLKTYFEVPPYILNDREDLGEWARAALAS